MKPTGEADVWAGACDRLVRFVCKLGVDPATAEDIAQETAYRAVANDVPFTDVEDLLRWCQTVARRLAMDEHRRAKRTRLVLVHRPETAVADVAEIVADRDLLGRALSEVRRLPEAQREAIMATVSPEQSSRESRKDQVRLAAARSRARSSLRAAVGYGLGLVAAMVSAVRRFVRAAPAMASVAAATALVTGLLSTPNAAGGAPVISQNAAPPAAVAWHHQRPVSAAVRGAVTAKSDSVRRGAKTSNAPSRSQQIAKVHSNGVILAADQRPQNSADHLLCLHGGPLPGRTCVG